MSKKTNYYSILGVPRNATVADIKASYKKMLLLLEQKAPISVSKATLTQAFNTLVDPVQRSEYNKTLPEGIYYWEDTQVYDWNNPNKKPEKKPEKKPIVKEVSREQIEAKQKTEARRVDQKKVANADFVQTNNQAAVSAPPKKDAGFYTTKKHPEKQVKGKKGRKIIPKGKGAFNRKPILTRNDGPQPKSVYDTIQSENSRTNTLLLAIGLGSPILTLIGTITYILLQ